MRVTAVISGLTSGGAERVLSLITQRWAHAGHHVTVVTLESRASDFHALDPRVVREALGINNPSRSRTAAALRNAGRIARLRRSLRASRPDVLVAFTAPTTVLTLLAVRGTGIPVIVCERNVPQFDGLPRPWHSLRRWTYPWASAVVAQTPEVAEWARAFVPAARVHVVPNPVVPPRPHAEGESPTGALAVEGPYVAAIGRLLPEKGFDLLLRAFARCHERAPEWRLVVIGEGADRPSLEALASELGVAEAVAFVGRQADPTPLLRGAQIFVLSSRHEGFPNALLEAMALGLPVIAADCPHGPRHIVRHGVDGLLVPGESSTTLATAMAVLMGDAAARRALGARAAEVTERFSLDRVMAAWNGVIAGVLAGRTTSDAAATAPDAEVARA